MSHDGVWPVRDELVVVLHRELPSKEPPQGAVACQTKCSAARHECTAREPLRRETNVWAMIGGQTNEKGEYSAGDG